jgi:hypothetical protein
MKYQSSKFLNPVKMITWMLRLTKKINKLGI